MATRQATARGSVRLTSILRIPHEGRSPRPGDAGEVVLIDLKSGEERVIAQSRGWEVQVGANVQWGRSDAELYFNDVDRRTWRAFAVQMNPATGARRDLDGTVFMVSRDGASLVSHNFVKSRRVLPGYGVILPDDRMVKNIGPVADDGIYVTDTDTGRSRMSGAVGSHSAYADIGRNRRRGTPRRAWAGPCLPGLVSQCAVGLWRR